VIHSIRYIDHHPTSNSELASDFCDGNWWNHWFFTNGFTSKINLVAFLRTRLHFVWQLGHV